MKPKTLFIMFTDVDKTFLPPDGQLNLDTVRALSILIKRIMEEHPGLIFKICPVTGRDAQYTEKLMVEINQACAVHGIQNITELGACEQGAILLDIISKKRFYVEECLHGHDEQFLDLLHTLKKTLSAKLSPKLFETFGGPRFTTFFFKLKDKYLDNMSDDAIETLLNLNKLKLSQAFFYQGLKHQPQITTIANRYIEITPYGFNKEAAIKRIYFMYHKDYHISGISFSGDSLNDVGAVKLMGKFSKNYGIKAHVFLPANAHQCVTSIEAQCVNTGSEKLSREHIIMKGESNYLQGVTECLRQCYEEGRLFSTTSPLQPGIFTRQYKEQSFPNNFFNP